MAFTGVGVVACQEEAVAAVIPSMLMLFILMVTVTQLMQRSHTRVLFRVIHPAIRHSTLQYQVVYHQYL